MPAPLNKHAFMDMSRLVVRPMRPIVVSRQLRSLHIVSFQSPASSSAWNAGSTAASSSLWDKVLQLGGNSATNRGAMAIASMSGACSGGGTFDGSGGGGLGGGGGSGGEWIGPGGMPPTTLANVLADLAMNEAAVEMWGLCWSCEELA